ncbi:abscisic acid-deficient protein Aba4 family protein [Calothrix sp. NIES-2098]|uniref:abscisic acid-deficient protein Aba4 family protein n=1 Tax=Calothrix sp. NIES-2098 TaxID=1954171 RepID=UPI000BBBFF4F
MNITQLFNVANLFVLPFWALMILLPNWKVTRRIMESYIPFVPLAGAYLYLFITSITPENAQALSNPQLADIARFFADEKAAATGWIHFLVMDLFVGRWIYWQGQTTGIWTIHSLVLCLFAGPLGVLSHILTYWITKTLSFSTEREAETVADKAISSSNS